MGQVRVSVNLSFRNSHWSSVLSNDITVNLITFSKEIANYVEKI